MSSRASTKPNRFGISRKVAALFLLLAAMAGAYQLVVYRAQQQLEGIAEDINSAGRLRYRSQEIRASVLDAVLTQTWSDETTNLINKFADRLSKLEDRGLIIERLASTSSRKFLPVLDQTRAAWIAYRQDVQSLLKTRPTREAAQAQLTRIRQESDQVLSMANEATTFLAERAEAIRHDVWRTLTWLTTINLAILLTVFFITRRQVVRPLRQLADASLRFAEGDYSARSGFRAQDEIGRVSEAFDHMAGQTEQHIEVIAADLKEIRQQQDTLKKLSSAVENSPASVVITDADAVIQYVNPAFTKATGYSYNEAVGQKPAMLKSGATPEETYQALWQTIRTGGIWSGELMNRKKSGELFWENTRISSVRNEQGEITHFVCVKEDVTQRRRAEQDLLFLNLNLEKHVAERTRQLEDAYIEQEAFSYSVSHDLRAPLRAINGFAHALAEDYADSLQGEAQGHLNRIQEASIRMGQIIDDMLELGKVSKAELSVGKVNLSVIARAAYRNLAEQDPGRMVAFEVADDMLVSGDPRLLRIVMENLLGNAWKYTSGREEASIALGASKKEGERVFFVRDNGAGFNMAYADKLFKPFHRLHSPSEYEGTGIGLAIAHRVISRHGGRIWAQAERGKGATFYFTLPDTG